ncbi:proteasome subunit beta type, putative [Pediculus humanus corporis]|uniref:Proteasome subunit beta n=1 Tax=Pediculus humanus subsp. corporis TaxID=121224 RepID=E0VWC5_PEDHC|nr:proteasome subunit beta type, putative [Pediculus humanus corporis]EEB17681.1 proteasome subunit beta type, putative [Pediculus humanus corporis]
MECLMGMSCKDFVILAADMTKTQSILVMKNDEEKLFPLTDKMVMAVCGDSGDTSQFSEFISKNIQLYKMRNGYALSPSAASNFTRRNLADYLRSRTPYNVNLLLGGYDDTTDEFELYFCDYLASLVKTPYAVHGFGGHFCLSIMDQLHRKDLTIEEGYEVLSKCIREIHKRVVINLPNFKVQVVTRNGIKNLEPITAAKLARESKD